MALWPTHSAAVCVAPWVSRRWNCGTEDTKNSAIRSFRSILCNPFSHFAAYTGQMAKRLILLAALCAGLAAAHPMGNFSVNHYARLEPGAHGVAIRYVMDLAEIPTFEMFQQWGSGAAPQQKAREQAREWAANLEITVNGRRVPARVVRAHVALAEGA